MSSKELRKSFTPNYFSVEDIIASQTRVPCTTEVKIHNHGFLDPSLEEVDLPVSSEVELPIWAAIVMSKQDRPYATVKLPKYFGDKYREVLKADPTVVDLNKMGPQFYQAGLQLCTLPCDEADLVSDVLAEVLLRRMRAMADSYSHMRDVKSTDEMVSDLGNTIRVNHMDPLEVQIFNDSKTAAEELDNWLSK